MNVITVETCVIAVRSFLSTPKLYRLKAAKVRRSISDTVSKMSTNVLLYNLIPMTPLRKRRPPISTIVANSGTIGYPDMVIATIT